MSYNHLVQKAQLSEKELISKIKTALEFNSSVCNTHRASGRRWTWKSSIVSDTHAFIRTLLSMDSSKSYSIEQITSLLNLNKRVVRDKLDREILMQRTSTSKCHRSYKYALGSSKLTKAECFSEVKMTYDTFSMNITDKMALRDLLTRMTYSNLSVSDILSMTSDDILEAISHVPTNYSTVILSVISKKRQLQEGFRKVRLAVFCVAKGADVEWVEKNICNRLSKELASTVKNEAKKFSDKLKDALMWKAPTRKNKIGTWCEWSDYMCYYEFKNGKKDIVTTEEAVRYTMEDFMTEFKGRYLKAKAKAENMMDF